MKFGKEILYFMLCIVFLKWFFNFNIKGIWYVICILREIHEILSYKFLLNEEKYFLLLLTHI